MISKQSQPNNTGRIPIIEHLSPIELLSLLQNPPKKFSQISRFFLVQGLFNKKLEIGITITKLNQRWKFWAISLGVLFGGWGLACLREEELVFVFIGRRTFAVSLDYYSFGGWDAEDERFSLMILAEIACWHLQVNFNTRIPQLPQEAIQEIPMHLQIASKSPFPIHNNTLKFPIDTPFDRIGNLNRIRKLLIILCISKNLQVHFSGLTSYDTKLVLICHDVSGIPKPLGMGVRGIGNIVPAADGFLHQIGTECTEVGD